MHPSLWTLYFRWWHSQTLTFGPSGDWWWGAGQRKQKGRTLICSDYLPCAGHCANLFASSFSSSLWQSFKEDRFVLCVSHEGMRAPRGYRTGPASTLVNDWVSVQTSGFFVSKIKWEQCTFSRILGPLQPHAFVTSISNWLHKHSHPLLTPARSPNP